MNKYLADALTPLKLAGVFVLICAGALILTARQELKLTADNLNGVVSEAGKQLNGRPGTAANHNKDKQEGLIENATKFLNDTRRDAVVAGKQEKTYTEFLKGQVETVSGKVNTLLDAGTGTLNSAKKTVDGLQVTEGKLNEVIESIPPVIVEGQKTIASLNTVINAKCDPEFNGFTLDLTPEPCTVAILHNVNRGVSNGADTLGYVSGTMKTIDLKVHDLAHPSKTQKVFNYTLDVVKASSGLAWLFK